MGRKNLYKTLLEGDGLSATDLANLRMPVVPTAVEDYVTAKYVVGPVSKVILTLASLPITVVDEAGVVGYGSAKLLDFPAGVVAFQGAHADLDVTESGAINADFDGDFGVGTTAAGNNAALATTEQNIIPTTATPQAVSSVTTANGQSTASEQTVVDGSSSAVDVYLNFVVDDADQAGGTLTVSGTLTILFSDLGDH